MVLGADRTGRVDGPVQFIDGRRAPHQTLGHQGAAAFQASGEAQSETGGQVTVQDDLPGRLRRSVGADHLDLAVGPGDASGQVIDHGFGAEHPALVAGLDPALGGDGVGRVVADDLVSLQVEAPLAQAVIRRRRRRGRRPDRQGNLHHRRIGAHSGGGFAGVGSARDRPGGRGGGLGQGLAAQQGAGGGAEQEARPHRRPGTRKPMGHGFEFPLQQTSRRTHQPSSV